MYMYGLNSLLVRGTRHYLEVILTIMSPNQTNINLKPPFSSLFPTIRRILIFPRGNNSSFLSAYLDAPEAQYTPLHMSPKAAFILTLVNHQDPSKSFHKGVEMI